MQLIAETDRHWHAIGPFCFIDVDAVLKICCVYVAVPHHNILDVESHYYHVIRMMTRNLGAVHFLSLFIIIAFLLLLILKSCTHFPIAKIFLEISIAKQLSSSCIKCIPYLIFNIWVLLLDNGVPSTELTYMKKYNYMISCLVLTTLYHPMTHRFWFFMHFDFVVLFQISIGIN